MSDEEPVAEPFILSSLMGGDDEFMNQLKGSGAANALTFLFFVVFFFIRKKLKHSSCEGGSICCRFKIKDGEEESDLERGESRFEERFEGRYVPSQIKEKLWKLYTSFHSGVLQEREEVAATD